MQDQQNPFIINVIIIKETTLENRKPAKKDKHAPHSIAPEKRKKKKEGIENTPGIVLLRNFRFAAAVVAFSVVGGTLIGQPQ